MKAGRAALAIGIALAGTCFAIHPHATPPLYDGIGFPDEPYRYISPPPNSIKTKPPAGASGTAQLLSDHSNNSFTFATVEKGPQIKVSVRIGVLQAPADATAILGTVEPVTTPTLPANGEALGNAYRIDFTGVGSHRPVTFNNIATFEVFMRIPVATRNPVALELLENGTWMTLRTLQTGNDIYEAEVPAMGDIMPVLITDDSDKALAATAKTGGAQGLVIALVIGVLVVVGVVVFTIRTKGMRERAAAQQLAQPPGD